MDNLFGSFHQFTVTETTQLTLAQLRICCLKSHSEMTGRRNWLLSTTAQFDCAYHRKFPKNLRHFRREKLPVNLEIGYNGGGSTVTMDSWPDGEDDSVLASIPTSHGESIVKETECLEGDSSNEDDGMGAEWEADEIAAISSLFKGRVPQKPGESNRERPLPLPIPHKIRPLGLPTRKRFTRTVPSPPAALRQSWSNQVYKNPTFLIGLAEEIKNLPPEDNVSSVLNKWAPFLRKGSLSLTVRELGRMDLPERALQTFSWVQGQPLLYPDDRILASTVEVLARAHELKMPLDWEKFVSLASRSVYEAAVRGLIKGGRFILARKLLTAARHENRSLDASLYAKLLLEVARNPDRTPLVSSLLEELAERENFNLSQQDCTSVMKVCIRLRKFEMVEALYAWFKKSGQELNIVMYTTIIHSRYLEEKLREALAVVWEMEASNCLLDLPAYRVVIKLFVALDDHSRAARYFSKLKEAGFSPTFDIYRDVIRFYSISGRLAKCKEVCKEAEMSGFKLDDLLSPHLLHPENT